MAHLAANGTTGVSPRIPLGWCDRIGVCPWETLGPAVDAIEDLEGVLERFGGDT